MHPLAIMTENGWEFGFGDADFLGWTITAAYFASAGLAAWAWRGEHALGKRAGKTARPLVWGGLAALLVLLGFNKQLDLQHALIFAVRDAFAAEPSLWSNRYAIAGSVAAVMAACSLAGGAVAFRYVGAARRRYMMAFVGLAYLGTFIFARAGSFLPVLNKINGRHLDAMHLLLELGSLIMIGAGAARAIGYVRDRQRAVRQDLVAVRVRMSLTEGPAVGMRVGSEPPARQAA